MGKYLDKQGVETLWNKTKALNGLKQDRTSAELDTEAKEIVPAINEAAAAAKSAQERADVSAKTDGCYAEMRVGTADNLTARGDATEETFTRRTAGGDNAIEEGTATIKAIKGNSVVLNNRVNMTSAFATFGDIVTQSDGSILYTITTKGGTEQYINTNRITFKESRYSANDKVLILCKVLAPYDSTQRAFVSGYSDTVKISFTAVRYDTTAEEWSQCTGIATVPKDGSYDFRVGFPTLDVSAVGDKFQLKEVQSINLTQMFGSGNEPATPEEFAARLGYASVADIPYIPYNEGTIVDMTATGIRTAGTDDDGLAWTQERSWKPVLDKYFGGHLRSAGNVRDEITANKAVKRIGFAEDIGKFIWGTNSGVWPTVSIYSFSLNTLPKQEGAIIASQNFSKLAVEKDSNAIMIILPKDATSAADAKAQLAGISLCYELAQPEEHDIDGQNLTIKVAPDGTEEIIAPEGGDVIASAPVVVDMVYPIDSYKTIKDNKAHIGSVSILATAAKSDLVAAINELTGRVAALETKATAETSTTEEEQ